MPAGQGIRRKLRAGRVLPPRKLAGACSARRTEAPLRRAAIAAHKGSAATADHQNVDSLRGGGLAHDRVRSILFRTTVPAHR